MSARQFLAVKWIELAVFINKIDRFFNIGIFLIIIIFQNERQCFAFKIFQINSQQIYINKTYQGHQRNLNSCMEAPCGENAVCIPGEKYRLCRCSCGFYGNPIVKCEFLPPSKVWRGALWAKSSFNISTEDSIEELFLRGESFIEMKSETRSKEVPFYVSRSATIEDVKYNFSKNL